MTDWLANISIGYVIAAIVVLFIARLIFGRRESPTSKSAAEISESALIAIVLVFLIIRPFVVQAFYIPSGSMRPTLLERDHILVNKFIYRFHEPREGDIVVFKSPPGASLDGQERDFIKRLIGLPGDVIRVTSGYVLIDGLRNDHVDLKSLLSSDPSPETTSVKLERDGALVDGRFLSLEQFARKLGRKNAKALKIVPGQTIRNGKPLDDPYTREDPDYDMPPLKVPNGKYFVMGDNRNNSNDSHAWGTLDRKRIIGKAMFRFWPFSRFGLIGR